MKEPNRWIQTSRVLHIYRRLCRGEIIYKAVEADSFHVTEKTIQRDIEDIRDFLSEVQRESETSELLYSRANKGYVMKQAAEQLTSSDVLAIAKVLLESRAFCRQEIDGLLHKLLFHISPEERKKVQTIIANEQFHYRPLQHGKALLDVIWCLSQAVKHQRLVRLEYKKEQETGSFTRVVEPQGIIFSEYYFYLIACIHDAHYDFPAIYRVDRIQDLTTLEDGFSVSYCQRFEEGEFRKRVQFMQSGSLQRVIFRYWGKSLEAVMDRLPTAKILSRAGNSTLVEAEVFGQGIAMWLLSQGEYVEVVEPKEFREQMKKTVGELTKIYAEGTE